MLRTLSVASAYAWSLSRIQATGFADEWRAGWSMRLAYSYPDGSCRRLSAWLQRSQSGYSFLTQWQTLRL